MSDKRLNLSDSQYDQDTYLGRVQHFVKLTNPLNLTLSGIVSYYNEVTGAIQMNRWKDDELTRARSVVEAYKNGENLGLTSTQLWEAKYQHDSAYHPDTGKKMFLPGRYFSANKSSKSVNWWYLGCRHGCQWIWL